MGKNIAINSATTDDIAQMMKLSLEKRLQYEKAQPLFWKKADDSEAVQTNYFLDLLKNTNFMLLTAKHDKIMFGFIIGHIVSAPSVYNPGGLTCMVDDFCINNETSWQSTGALLLDALKIQAKKLHAIQIVIVSGDHDKNKKDFLQKAELAIVSNWYQGSL